MANVLTGGRILCSILMIPCPVISREFFCLYLAAGLTDMIDGAVARKLKQESRFGAKFDTAADMIFILVASCKILPVINIPMSIWLWAVIIAAIKITNIIMGFIICKQFISIHSIANKMTGFVLFLLPLTLNVYELKVSAMFVCCIATFAAIQENYFIRKRQSE
ncbi:MAG: CDP-alcohol phosphatidyltransferase family protein [Clostridiales bacterium]|nr:CDP-alcohol phosphatidyltransferase family protein [Clostridiales bacterium]